MFSRLDEPIVEFICKSHSIEVAWSFAVYLSDSAESMACTWILDALYVDSHHIAAVVIIIIIIIIK